jgi:hypothetical protein
MGKMQRRKGYEFERKITNWFRDRGIPAQRVPLSGGTMYAKGDIDIYLNGEDEAPTIAECKVRSRGFTNLYDWMADDCDILIIKQDRQEPLVVMTIDYFADNWRAK